MFKIILIEKWIKLDVKLFLLSILSTAFGAGIESNDLLEGFLYIVYLPVIANKKVSFRLKFYFSWFFIILWFETHQVT